MTGQFFSLFFFFVKKSRDFYTVHQFSLGNMMACVAVIYVSSPIWMEIHKQEDDGLSN